MNKLFALLCMFLTFSTWLACYEGNVMNSSVNEKKTTLILDRFGYTFNMYKFDESGYGVASIGRGSYYVDEFLIESVEDSIDIKIDSVELYFSKLKIFEAEPEYGPLRRDAHHIEIYSGKTKVYDSYRFDYKFWNLLKTILSDIPDEFNPYTQND